MTPQTWWWVGALAAAGALGLALWLAWGRPRGGIDVRTARPAALRHHTLWAREQAFACRSPVALTGRIDECFVDRRGVVTVADTKLRRRPVVHDTDVLQLSAYRVLLESGARKVVSPVGYLRLITPLGNRYTEVRLLPAAAVVAAAERYRRLRAGRDRGRRCGNPALCRRCEYKVECDALGD